jgi:4-hydroxybenzoate polyprenyltransferase
MKLGAIPEITRLVRFEVLVAIFAALLLPVWHLSHNWRYAVNCSLPTTIICACGFILNNLYDIERDRENHPERALPREALSLGFASTLYFLLLAVALVLVKAYATESNVFLYLLLFLATVNYNVIIAFRPVLKNLFVALIVVLVAILLQTFERNGHPPNALIMALFLYCFGMEMLSDIRDAKADGATLVKKIGLRRAPWIAFSLKIVADLILLATASGPIATGLAVMICGSDIVGAILWPFVRLRSIAVQIMRTQSVVGIY